MLVALTRAVSQSINLCALSYLDREPIDVARAERQHRAYEETLERQGVRVERLRTLDHLPDAVFVEDTAVVVDEAAVAAAPRLESRQQEVSSVGDALKRYRPIATLTAQASLEGGDIMRIGRAIYAGLSERTNRDGVTQLGSALGPYGYDVRPVTFANCLHLKSACTYLGRGTVIANPERVDCGQFDGVQILEVAASEPAAANVLRVGETLVMPSGFPQTEAKLERCSFTVETVDVSELQKAEAGVTCCCLLFSV